MSTANSEGAGPAKPLRLWPGVAIVATQWILRFVIPPILPEAAPIGLIAGMIGGPAILVWWVFFSRAAAIERYGAVALMILGYLATMRLADVSIATGAQGFLLLMLAIPGVSLAFVVWAAATRRLGGRLRVITMAAAILLSFGVWTLFRTGGFTSSFDNQLTWRWEKSPEERLLERAALTPAPVREPAPMPEVVVPVEKEAPGTPAPVPAPEGPKWPGFRGPERDGVVRGIEVASGWDKSPPVELWRRAVGPGWSSFAVEGGLLYTQEQRGEEEIVACYRTATGAPVWMHRDRARFWESNAGAGPRATPTLYKGRVYTLGGTGIANVLRADTGAVVWSRDAAADTGAKQPDWGFSGSPLVYGDTVIFAVSGRLIAYDIVTGNPRWQNPEGGASYSSPQLATIDGVPQILLLNSAGAVSVAAADGAPLWKHEWKGYPIVQPAVIGDGSILIAVNESSGTRRLSVTHGQAGWTVEERWTSNGLKPFFNDFVLHKGHAYGFDGGILASIDLANGKRKWKGGRYGQGQLVLLADQDLLLVLSESGELALVSATPDQYAEVARRPALEGKTWNHPVITGDVLLVRNAEEMAAFRLARRSR